METLISFILAVSILAISPGPDNIFVLMQSVVHGKKYGLATIIGLMTGCIVHTIFVAVGISTIIKENNTIFLVIKILGAVYLLYLAYKVITGGSEISMSTEKIDKKTPFQLFKIGFIMNVLNPKVTLFFLALFPGFLFSEILPISLQFYTLGALFILVSFVVFSLIAILGGTISEKIKTSKNIGVWLQWMQVFVFIGIAVFILI
ncbi:LysE family translocator [Flavobacteriaceae bacterium]|jgi:threonine/homoserine/homoserine lactone efflux protein|nr:LysE family translocator [Flavobacteriaceae bacterium]MDB9893913.1 LysE family translocator [Flavobacteriaceae bacterium]MDC1342596.1 LysE family translocator [Flavobacteriaceae bacterium]|tara:strand:+ start:820 stop:1431 length:612 start_codon:yes stop_codon:yes gene_type:complete